MKSDGVGPRRLDVGNNGTRDTDYATSIANRTADPSGTGLFFNGATSGTAYANFDIGVARLTSYDQGSSAGVYTAQSGDTLASIAASLWGDASLWYKLAQANGMSANAALSEGQTLIIPPGVNRATNNATTFNPYDPNDALGNLAPTRVKPPTGKEGCGVMGQIMMVVLAIAITVAMHGTTTSFFAKALGDKAVAGALDAAVASAAGSAASQVAGVAAGNKFSWNAVGLAALGDARRRYAQRDYSITADGWPDSGPSFGVRMISTMGIIARVTRNMR
ncbi:MAG: LysM domain-containing protein [Pseudomonadota bacterium]